MTSFLFFSSTWNRHECVLSHEKIIFAGSQHVVIIGARGHLLNSGLARHRTGFIWYYSMIRHCCLYFYDYLNMPKYPLCMFSMVNIYCYKYQKVCLIVNVFNWNIFTVKNEQKVVCFISLMCLM